MREREEFLDLARRDLVNVDAADAMMRSANLRAASTYVGSFIKMSACRGVLVRSRRTVQASREGASRIAICGGAAVRFQNVYRLRRWTFSGPVSAVKRAVLLLT